MVFAMRVEPVAIFAGVALALGFLPAATASPSCKCEWHPANSSVNADATCYVDEDNVPTVRSIGGSRGRPRRCLPRTCGRMTS
jgi:hypothetical protein